MRLFRILLDPNAVAGGAAPAAPAVQNPHPAAVQPPPAGVPNPLTGQPSPVQVFFQGQNPGMTPFQVAPQYAQPAVQPAVAAQPVAPLLGAAAAAAASPAAATPDQMVPIPLSQLQAFTAIQARLADMEAAQRHHQDQAQQEQARLLAENGRAMEALNLLRQQTDQTLQGERDRAAAIERDAARYALDGELSRALAGQPLVPGGAEQLTQLWRNQFTAVRENGTFAVRTPTFESPAQFVGRMIADPNYAHFVRASTQGGTATGQTTQAAQTPPAHPEPAPQPRNMGEAVILHMQGLQKAQGDGRVNMGLPMGLRAAPRG